MGVASAWPRSPEATDRYFVARSGGAVKGEPSDEWRVAGAVTSPAASNVIEIAGWDELRTLATRKKKVSVDG